MVCEKIITTLGELGLGGQSLVPEQEGSGLLVVLENAWQVERRGAQLIIINSSQC